MNFPFLYGQLKFLTMEAITIYSPSAEPERLTPKDLVKKHIADPTHKITEEEFDNMIVGVFSSEAMKDRRQHQ
jgi:hypothetical protein